MAAIVYPPANNKVRAKGLCFKIHTVALGFLTSASSGTQSVYCSLQQRHSSVERVFPQPRNTMLTGSKGASCLNAQQLVAAFEAGIKSLAAAGDRPAIMVLFIQEKKTSRQPRRCPVSSTYFSFFLLFTSSFLNPTRPKKTHQQQ